MKNLIRLLALLAFAGFLFTACQGPEGPAGLNGKDGANGLNGKDGNNGLDGKDGTNGTNGTNGLNGKDANSSCLTCHTTANWTAKTAEYRLSKHFKGNTSARNTRYCAKCHTHDGFLEVTGADKYAISNDMPNAVRINCQTCHAHSAFDFTDTLHEILRTTAPVFLNYNNNKVATDFGKTNNLCTNCHQIRGVTSVNYTDSTGAIKTFNQLPFFPFVAGQDDQAPVKYQVGQSFSVHDGNQSNLFAGVNGYEYAGKTYTRTWKHSSFSCTDCHMNEYDATTKTGGHTLLPNEDVCEKCHQDDRLTPVRLLIDAKRIELADLLVARKVFKKTTNSTTGAVSYSAVQTHDFYGTLFPGVESTTLYATALASGNTVSPTTGLVIYGSKVTMAADKDFATRIGREWKYGELGAAYNYAFINSELSMGVHNPKYALDLLQNSIEWIRAN